MTTYNSYEAAKIANSEREIYYTIIANSGKDAVFGLFDELNKFTDAIHKCNPADHCVTVGELRDKHGGEVGGDIILGYGSGYVRIVTQAEAKDRSYDRENFILRAAALEEKKPRTKVEYVKVADSIFDLRHDFEAGELFSRVNHARDYSAINNTQTLAQALHQMCCYRCIETPMTEREAFIEAVSETLPEYDKSAIPLWIGKLYDSGKFKLVEGE